MGSPGYAAQRLWQAVDSLGEPQPQHLRAEAAQAFHHLVFLDAEDFHDLADRAAFESLMARATSVTAVNTQGELGPVTDEGTIADSIQLMPLTELRVLVQDLLELQSRYPFPPD